MPESSAFHFSHAGTCPACEQEVTFSASGPYFRNTLKCPNCGSAPRHRALMHVLAQRFPKWRELRIHESSPGWDKVSQRLAAECTRYTASQYDLTAPFGSMVEAPHMPCKRYHSENLEAQTFADASFDLVVMQDVFEHIMHPDLAIKEIARTLAPGGALVMTVPILNKARPSVRRASAIDGEIVHLLEAQYHGNPLGGGSLVTVDWGYDIAPYLQRHSDLSVLMVRIDDIDHGIRADLNEVIIAFRQVGGKDKNFLG